MKSLSDHFPDLVLKQIYVGEQSTIDGGTGKELFVQSIYHLPILSQYCP